MENECRNLVLHFSDEKEVLSRESILVNFNVFRENVIVEHNGNAMKSQDAVLTLTASLL